MKRPTEHDRELVCSPQTVTRYFLNFGVDEATVDLSLFNAYSCSSDSSLVRDGKLSQSSSFRPDKVLAKLNLRSDGILT